MEVTPGIKTTEFWLTALTTLVLPVLALLVGYGLLSQEQADLWQQLLVALIAVIVPVSVAIVNKSYNESRTALKIENMTLESGASE